MGVGGRASGVGGRGGILEKTWCQANKSKEEAQTKRSSTHLLTPSKVFAKVFAKIFALQSAIADHVPGTVYVGHG